MSDNWYNFVQEFSNLKVDQVKPEEGNLGFTRQLSLEVGNKDVGTFVRYD